MSSKVFFTIKDYEVYLLEQAINIDLLSSLDASEIFLIPFGEKGGYKKNVKVKAINGKVFSGIELLWNAHNVQAPFITGRMEIEKGVGLHRLGFEKSTPSFYIGRYYDSAELLKK